MQCRNTAATIPSSMPGQQHAALQVLPSKKTKRLTIKQLRMIITVDSFISNLAEPFAGIIAATRKIFLGTDKQIGEIIKWNAPCFVYTGEMKPFNPKEYKRDIAVVQVHRNEVLIVFPTGAKITGGKGLLEGNYKDGRKIARIHDMNDLRAKEKLLQQVLKEWLQLVEK
jgi:hypothetical protein